MYTLSNSQEHNPFQITDHEKLWDKISNERVLEILNQPEVTVISCERSHNNYGEFLFLKLRKGNRILSLYGMGEHERRGVVYSDMWCIGDFSLIHKWDEGKSLNKFTVEQQIYGELSRRQRTQPESDYNEVYNMVADLTDEDYAQIAMEDGELDF